MNGKNKKQLTSFLDELIPKHDLVIVSDYGHGLISKRVSNLICKRSKYLAVNAQVNAANRGYHSMRNYKNVDCVIINETEMKHELRDRNGKNEVLMNNGTLIQGTIISETIESIVSVSERLKDDCLKDSRNGILLELK